MSGGVFVLQGDQTLVEMQPASFASENTFQDLLARFPSLLDGAQINAAAPRRWILVAREKSVTDKQDGSGRWALDHLFLDQDGIPTLVEVKRQSDTRLRREVVGQMLDYAANGVAWWSLEEIKAAFTATCEKDNIEPSLKLADLIRSDIEPDVFWQSVQTNLQAGRIRMLFVADVIPPELRRIVEFLNRQMNPAEVLALELRQFEAQGMRTIVPLLYGQSEAARSVKAAPAEKRLWDGPAFYAELEQQTDAASVEAARKIEAWMRANADKVWFGSGAKNGSLNSAVAANGYQFFPLAIWTSGDVCTVLNYCRKPPFDDPQLIQRWADKLAAAAGSGVKVTAGSVIMPLSLFAKHPAALTKVLEAERWAFDQMRQSPVTASVGDNGPLP